MSSPEKKDLKGITPYPKDWFEKRGIDYLLGKTVVGLDLTHKEVVLFGERMRLIGCFWRRRRSRGGRRCRA